MNPIVKIVSLIALLATIVPSLIFFAGGLEHDVVKIATLIGSIVWFAATPWWMGRVQPTETEAARAEI